MRKKLLTVILSLVLIAVLVSCPLIDKTIDNLPQSSVDVTEEQMLSHTDDTEKFADLKDVQQIQVEKSEDTQREKEDSKVNNTEVVNKQDGNAQINKDILECTLSVRCDVVFENTDKIDEEKLNILPQSGIIFPKTKVVFYDGESVFNVLTRELKKKGIHIDFVKTPMYNSIYIRGISNLYERDCGELSGWIYMVNDKVPGYGCSQFILKDGDEIEFLYTCDFGKDIN